MAVCGILSKFRSLSGTEMKLLLVLAKRKCERVISPLEADIENILRIISASTEKKIQFHN